jgi:hypothetical protein
VNSASAAVVTIAERIGAFASITRDPVVTARIPRDTDASLIWRNDWTEVRGNTAKFPTQIVEPGPTPAKHVESVPGARSSSLAHSDFEITSSVHEVIRSEIDSPVWR